MKLGASVFGSDKGNSRGYTLMEMLIATALAGMVVAIVIGSFKYSGTNFAAMGNYSDLDRKSRNALDLLGREIRNSSALVAVGTSPKSLTFSNERHDGKKHRYPVQLVGSHPHPCQDGPIHRDAPESMRPMGLLALQQGAVSDFDEHRFLRRDQWRRDRGHYRLQAGQYDLEVFAHHLWLQTQYGEHSDSPNCSSQ